jgi:hypothetical protein
MSQAPEGQFRGRIPGTGGPDMPVTEVRWGWSRVSDDRPRLSWFGLFLVLFGGLLIVEQLFPGARALGSGLVVAVGVSLLIAWAANRQVWQLYAGAILTALSLPALLQDLTVIQAGSGWGTLFLGIAFLLIAAIRAGARGGVGWQAIVGGLLAVVGGLQVAEQVVPNFPSIERLFWPAVILAVGLLLVWRSTSARRNQPPGSGYR